MPGARSVVYLFMVALVVPASAFLIIPDRSVATIELRTPQNMPAFPQTASDLNSWPGRFDNYIRDHFPLRSWLIEQNSRLWLSLGESGSKEVLVGKEGWLYLARDSDVTEECRGLVKFEPAAMDSWIAEMARRTEWLEARGIDYWLVLIPDKQSVYPQYLPTGFDKVGPSVADQLVERLKGNDRVRLIDLRPMIIDHAISEQIYNKTDSHWNDYGAYISYCELANQVSKRKPIHYVDQSQVEFHEEAVEGDLAGLLNLKSDLKENATVATILNPGVVETGEGGDYRFEGWGVTTTHREACRGLVFCDSFTNRYMKKYLKETFSYSFYHHHQNIGFDEGLVEREKPDVVLYILTERLIIGRPKWMGDTANAELIDKMVTTARKGVADPSPD